MIVHIWWLFQHFIGMDNPSGRPYAFWSGFGSDLGELALVGAVVRWIRVSVHNHEEHMELLRNQGESNG